jgi:cytochrome c-type biogenesis protein CcmE
VKAKHQRLILALLALVALIGAGLLAASALKDQAAYFYAPGDLAAANVPPGKRIRLGGMVADKSIRRVGDGVTIDFIVSDGRAQTPVRFRGIPPAGCSSPTTFSPSMTSAICRQSWQSRTARPSTSRSRWSRDR